MANSVWVKVGECFIKRADVLYWYSNKEPKYVEKTVGWGPFKRTVKEVSGYTDSLTVFFGKDLDNGASQSLKITNCSATEFAALYFGSEDAIPKVGVSQEFFDKYVHEKTAIENCFCVKPTNDEVPAVNAEPDPNAKQRIPRKEMEDLPEREDLPPLPPDEKDEEQPKKADLPPPDGDFGKPSAVNDRHGFRSL